MKYGISTINVIPIRKLPEEQSEMVSQLLFGEIFCVLSELDQWIEISCDYDGYTGWINKKLYTSLDEASYHDPAFSAPKVLQSLIMGLELPDHSMMMITAGSSLPNYNPIRGTVVIHDLTYMVRWTCQDFDISTHAVHETALRFMHTPYLWGGRSFFGSDCSGFVQLIHKMHGMVLPRDASQQEKTGEKVASLSHGRPGDLAFFADPNGHVSHVGILLDQGRIVHNSGSVQISRLTETGILSSDNLHYTHILHSIRRISKASVVSG
jgi:hypothetical protein